MDSIYAASPLAAIASSVILQLLKRSDRFAWLSSQTGKANAWMSGMFAFLTAIGLVFSFDFDKETGAIAAGVHGNVWDILHVVMHTPIQFLQQHAFYQAALKPADELAAIRVLLSGRTTKETT